MTSDLKTQLAEQLLDATWRLLEADKSLRAAETYKKKLRAEFFRLADQSLIEDGQLEQKTVFVPYIEGFDIDHYLEQEYPSFTVMDVAVRLDSWACMLMEIPAFRRFSYINPENGMVFSRQVAQVGQSFNAAAFMLDHPDLAADCIEVETVYRLDEKRAMELAEDDPEVVGILQDYTVPGKPQPRMAAARKATEDDLG